MSYKAGMEELVIQSTFAECHFITVYKFLREAVIEKRHVVLVPMQNALIYRSEVDTE